MTRKHFERLAFALYQARCSSVEYAEGVMGKCHAAVQADCTAELVADELAKFNPRFDRAQFLRACEEGGTGKVKKTTGGPAPSVAA